MNRKLKALPENPTEILMESTHINILLVEKEENTRNNSIILGNYMFFCHMPVSLATFESLEEIKWLFVFTHWCD